MDREHRQKALGVAICHCFFGLVGRRTLDQFVQGLVSKGSSEGLPVGRDRLVKREWLVVAVGPRFPKMEVAAPTKQGTDQSVLAGLLRSKVGEPFDEGHLVVVRGQEAACSFLGNAELFSELGLAHAVHDPKIDDLGFLTGNAREVCNHLMQVDVPLVVGFDHIVDHVVPFGAADASSKVHQQAGLLRGVVERSPLCPILWDEQAAHDLLDFWVARWDLLQVRVRGTEPACHSSAVITAKLVKFRVDPPLVLVPQNRVDERAVSLVDLPKAHDHLGHRVVMC